LRRVRATIVAAEKQ